MRTFIIFLFCLITSFANATHYYYSTSGLNSNSGTSSSSPKQTIADFNTHTWAAGDSISFKRGDIFTGSILISQSGTAIKPIVLNAYGSGDNPIINGFSDVTSWTSAGGGIYYSNVFSPTTDIKMVYLNGMPAMRGRYPNVDAANGGYLTFSTYTNGTSTGTLTDNSLSSEGIDASWIGAEVRMRTTRSNIDAGAITDINTSTNIITYSNTNMFSKPTNPNWGYFLTGSKKTLDKFGEWYYDPTSKRIYMYFGSVNPDLNDVKATTIDILLDPRANYLTITDVDFKGANKHCIADNISGLTNFNLLNLKISFSGINGIALNGRVNFLMNNCIVEYCNSNGVNVGYHCNNTVIQSCNIRHIGYIASNLIRDAAYQGRVGYGIFSGAAIVKGITAINNKITDIGFMGLFFDVCNNYVYKNYVNFACTIMDDGAGIYTGNYIDTVQTNNVIRKNIVLNSKGAPFGAGGVNNFAVGIYMDDNSNNYIVDSNFVAGCGQYGFFFHNNWQGKIRCNMAFDNLSGQIGGQDDNINNQIGEIAGMVINKNTLFSKSSSEKSYFFQSAQNNFSTWGTIDSNIVCNPFNESGNIAYLNAFNTGVTNYTFATWRSSLGHDIHGNQTPLTITRTDNILWRYTVDDDETIYFRGTYKSMDGVSHTGSITLPDYTGIILGK